MTRRIIIRDAATLAALGPTTLSRMLDAGVVVYVLDFIAEEAGGVSDPRAVVAETMPGDMYRNAMELWERAGRPADLEPLPLNEVDKMWALMRLLRAANRTP